MLRASLQHLLGTGHEPNTWAKVVEEDANLALLESDTLVPGDQLDGI